MNEMPKNLGENLLIAMSDSSASLNLIRIVADRIPDLAETEITLMHYLAPIYWEHGGVIDREDLDALRAEEKEIWQEERADKKETRRYFEQARSILVKAGIPNEHIHMRWAYEENDVTEAVLDTLKAGQYSSVIVGKHHHDNLERALTFNFTSVIHRQIPDVAVWVVDDDEEPSIR